MKTKLGNLGFLALSISIKNDKIHREMDNPRTHEDCERSSRPVAALASDHRDGECIALHRHDRAQLIHALTGVMTVGSRSGNWVVPSGRAVWMPPNEEHTIRIAGDVRMRTVFVRPDSRSGLPAHCEVIEVGPLLREAIVAATRIPLDYVLGGRDERVTELILDEIQSAPRLSLHVPMPRDARLARLCQQLIDDPSRPATLEQLAAEMHVSGRTLARLFHRELGIGFSEWLRRMRLLLSLPRLAAGHSIVEVALDHGYDSPSAFSAMFRRSLGAAPTVYLDRDTKSENDRMQKTSKGSAIAGSGSH